MEHPPTNTFLIVSPEPPPFPSSPRSVDLSPLEFILALVALVTIPALIYTFFFSIKCPPSCFRRRRSRERDGDGGDSANSEIASSGRKELVADLKYEKESHVKDVGSECPVCLSAFSDGEEVKQLSVCKHSFHGNCIDLWLNSHSNCPVCRASVAPPPSASSSKPRQPSSASRNDDFHQGLPDASALV